MITDFLFTKAIFSLFRLKHERFPISIYIQYCPIYYGLFREEIEKWKYHINCIAVYVRKTQRILERQMGKRFHKTAGFRFKKNVGGDRVWKIPSNKRFLGIKSFLCLYQKSAEGKISITWWVTPHPLLNVWEHRFINK